jgi:hypothetical protein
MVRSAKITRGRSSKESNLVVLIGSSGNSYQLLMPNHSPMRKTSIFILLAAVVGAAWLTTVGDNGLGLDWPHVAVRNWEQYGLFNLHGKMVINPGGFQADTNPEIYQGHRPASLYPVFWCHHLFDSIGFSGLGFVAYYACTTVMVLLSIWWLLGRTERAFWLAAIAVVAPGFIRWQTSLDPNLTAVLFGFPFCAAVIALTRRPSLNWPQVAMLFALILAFSALNWTTIFVHAMLFVTLFALSRVPRRHLILYAGLTAAMGGWVLLASVASKMGPAQGSSGGFTSMLQGYGWGNAGYGLDLSTKTALLRLLVTNILGLLPLLAYAGWQWWRRGGRSKAGGWLCLLPLMVATTEILGLRNYFGHHPWMSVHFVLLAMILAIAIWKDRVDAAPSGREADLPVRLAALAAAFAYSFIVLFTARVHNSRALALVTFVHKQTARNTTIVIRHDTDPALADMADRLANAFDRHVVIETETRGSLPGGLPANWVILTATDPTAGKIRARTILDDSPSPVLGPLLRWYSGHIAQRRAGDKLEIPGQGFCLYQPAD